MSIDGDGPGNRTPAGARELCEADEVTRLRPVLDAALEAMFVLRVERAADGNVADLLVVDLSEVALQLLEASADTVKGRSLRDVLAARTLQGELVDRLVEVAERGRAATFDARAELGGGRSANIRARVARVGPNTLLLAVVDLTEREALHNRASLDDRLASLGRLAASVAHELNNPLAWINATLEQVRAELALRSDSALVALLDESLEGTSRLQRVVEDLRAGAEPATVDPAGIDVGPTIHSSVRIAAHELQRVARVDVEIESDLPRALADSARLGQVLLNVLLNAGRAIAEAGRPGRIAVTATRSADRIVVAVADNGIGMDEVTLGRVVEPFFTTRPGGGGSGLGLWISASIVESTGGRLVIASTLGVGTEVRVELPVAVVATTERPRPRRPSTRPPQQPPERLRVLIVDDEPLVGRSLGRALKADHDVTVEQGAASALERIGDGERFDLVISDLTMPEMDGIGFFTTAETLDEELCGRIVLMTGGTSAEVMREIEARGMTMLSKPFDLVYARRLLSSFRRRLDG